MNVSGSEHESISRNSPEITNETHSKQQDQTESETEEDSRQELTEDEMLSQGIAHFYIFTHYTLVIFSNFTHAFYFFSENNIL